MNTLSTNTHPTARARITSIDALRGLTVAFMILVNDPGDWAHTYAPLDHAPWNGFTPTDLVFPTFLFLVGCAIVFSVSSRLKAGIPRATIALQILRRAFYIFAIKMFLTAFPYFHLTHMRIFGVLTRIALCYLIAGLIFLYFRSWRTLSVLSIAILIGYWLLMRFVPIPGLGHPVRDFPILDPDRNLAAYIDRGFNAICGRFLHTGSLYEKTRDPEGLLSTLPSVATTLVGILAALWLRYAPALPQRAGKWANLDRDRTRNGLLLAAMISLALGLLWNPWFPINKNLWTSSYVLYSAGWSLLLLGIFYWLFDSIQIQRTCLFARGILWPMLVYGSNALTAFILSNFFVKLLLWWKLPPAAPGAKSLTAWAWLYTHLFAFRGSTNNTSLVFAFAFVAVCFLPNWFLWRRKIFLRV